MAASITVEELRGALDAALTGKAELAILDVREAGQYAAGHLFFATHVPYSRLEIEIVAFVPRKAVPVVVYDAGDGVSEKAAGALAKLGYGDVRCLEGGAPGWAAAGHTLYEGVNLPSKTFGELVELAQDTPHISADDLAAMQDEGGDFVILDGRTPEEYGRFNIPGGLSCPNAELPLRFNDMVPNDRTTVVINCAGRTRSIIGAQTLINFGVPNKVVALENGTQGWALADRELETGARRFPPRGVMPPALEAAKARADALAHAHALSFVETDTINEWRTDETRTLYVFDVRSRGEFEAGHLQGSTHAPGGQLVQGTDRWVGVRGARIVVCDDAEVAAVCTAHWLKQMGWDVHVLKDGIGTEGLESGPVEGVFPESAADALEDITAGEVAGGDFQIIDMRASGAFRDGHIEGADWATRAHIAAALTESGANVVLVGDDRDAARLAAEDLRAAGAGAVAWLAGGMPAWAEEGFETVTETDDLPASARIDFIAFTAERHGGNKDHMRQYLEWEIGLVDQLDDQERGVFAIPGH